MHIPIGYGQEHLELEVPEERLVRLHRQPPAADLPDPAAAVRQALEEPLGFPPLRRALTPDDHVVLVVDEHLPRLGALLTAVLEHVTSAHVQPEAITLLCAPPRSSQDWLEDLPEAFQDVRIEVHDPADRKRLSYLATTRSGRRIYLNRTAVDADQLVVLTRRSYDPLLGYAGAGGALYPALSDEASRREAEQHLSLAAPGGTPWPLHKEAAEVTWLLGGAAFLVQVIDGTGSALSRVIGGLPETSAEGERLLDARWRVEVDRTPDVVVGSVTGDPGQQGFADLAAAAACAARVVRRGGRIILLTDSDPGLGEAAGLLRGAGDAGQALERLQKQSQLADRQAAFQWASAAEHARIYLLSRMPAETVEELFAVPLEDLGQVRRLLGDSGSCVVLPDAHKTLAVLRR